ncbi:MAG: glycosyltransferase family 2 protein, partial [Bryobacteraceae bacterium]
AAAVTLKTKVGGFRLPPSLCVIVPCYNEQEMLPAFFAKVLPALEQATEGRWTVLCVDDGSSDSTFATINEWHARDRRVSGLRLSRNFGHQAALSVGLAYARADYIGIMDCDLQDPIEIMVELYRACMAEGLDVCLGIRRKRDAPVLLRAAYSVFYYIIQRTADHDWPRDAGDFSVISERCQRALLALPEQSRMLRGLRSWVGFRQSGIPYDRPARLHGTTKYNLRKLTALALQGLISFSTIPLRLASIIGISMGFLSVLFGVLILINRLFPRFSVLGYWVGANAGTATVLVFLAFALSVLFVCMGIVGEYLIVLLQEIKKRPAGIVAAVVGDVRPQEAAYGLLEATNPPAAWSAGARE